MASYRLGVRIGNWLEDEIAQQDLLRDFIRKREKGQLFVQRLARLKENIFKKVELSVSSDGFVHFGDTVLLMNPDCTSPEEREPELRGDVTLAVDMEEVSLYSDEPLQISRGLSAVKRVDPIGRNAFCIVSVDGSAVGEPLRYGQNFLLGTKGGVSDKLFYLASDHKTFRDFAKKSRLQKVFLTGELSYLTFWQAKSLDPQLRLEHEGCPVPAETKIIITHCYTNRNLAVPRTFCVWSCFGREFEVICHNYLDARKIEEDKNYWEIITGNPGPEDGTRPERPKALPEGQLIEEEAICRFSNCIKHLKGKKGTENITIKFYTSVEENIQALENLVELAGFVPDLVSTLCLTCLVSLPEHSTEGEALLCQLPPSCWFDFALEAVKGNLILNAPFSWQGRGVGKSVTLL